MSKMRDMVLRPLTDGTSDRVKVPRHLLKDCDLPPEPGLYEFGGRTYRMSYVDGWATWERVESGRPN